MPQHQTTSPEEATSSANARVTPEELAKALAAVEARRERSAQEAAGTIPIGEAIQQLGFDASPDEVWVEIQAQRQHQAQVVGTRLPRKTRLRGWLAMGMGLFILLAFAFIVEEDSGAPSADVTSVITAPSQFAAPPPQTVIKTLAEIPNNGTFYCDSATAQTLLRHPAVTAQTLVTDGTPTTGEQRDDSWVFTKHDRVLYLHGFTAPRSAGAMQQGNIPVLDDKVDETGVGGLNYSERITLAVGHFKVNDFSGQMGDGVQQIVVSDIHPDSHFGDTW